MIKYIFDNDTELGQIVENVNSFCSISKNMKINNIEQITSDLCGHKFSKLCGFIFTSKIPSDYNKFSIVYCPKLKNNHIRNEKALSGWYCWKHIGSLNELVMSKRDMLNVYGFNVDKFFQSDLFNNTLPLFIKQCNESISTVIKQYIDSIQDLRLNKNAQFYINCIKTSLNNISDVVKTDFDTGNNKAKLAYNADQTYGLNMK